MRNPFSESLALGFFTHKHDFVAPLADSPRAMVLRMRTLVTL
jgi:hypothetical protein